MKIITNKQTREILTWFDLTPNEQKEFDCVVEGENSFFRYKGQIYDLGEFMRIDKVIAPHPQREGWEKWDGYSSDSFFSGVLVRYVADFESVIVGRFYS